jgi:hypothetical protein
MPEEILGPYRIWTALQKEFASHCDGYLNAVTDDEGVIQGEDLSDWVETIRTLLSFTPQIPDVAGMFHDDPYGYAIANIKEQLRLSIERDGSMSTGEYENLKAIEEFVRRRDNS